MAHANEAETGTRKTENGEARGKEEPERWRDEVNPEEWNPVAEEGQQLTKAVPDGRGTPVDPDSLWL